MGCSNAHPHGQIWASNFLPNEVHKKNENQLKYFQAHKTRLLNDYLTKELKSKERVILLNDFWAILVPYWAYWPFETIILPVKRNIKRIVDLTEEEKRSLAEILKRLQIKYDNLFECSFPYAFGWHGKYFTFLINISTYSFHSISSLICSTNSKGAPTGKWLSLNTDHWTLQ